MKKRMIMLIIISVLTVSLGSNYVYAADVNGEIVNKQKEFDNYNEKLTSNKEMCYQLGGKIEGLTRDIEENDGKIADIKENLKNTKKDISEIESVLKKEEEVLRNKLGSTYHLGGATGQGILLLNDSYSVGTLTELLNDSNILIKEDKEDISDLIKKKNFLDEKIKDLNSKKEELEKVSEDNKIKYRDIENKKNQYEDVVKKLEKEKNDYDSSELSKEEEKIITYYTGVIDFPKSTSQEIKESIDKLIIIKDKQLKSDIVKDMANRYIEYGNLRLEDMEKTNDKIVNIDKGSYIVNSAMEFLGVPYEWGANGPETFDCSGFTKYIYKNYANIELTRTTYTQVNEGVSVEFKDLQLGDLVFTYNGDHVGIYVGNGNYINASKPGDVVKISKIDNFYKARRII